MTTVDTTVTTAAVRAALDEVYDPCSQAWQRPLSLVDLGLVREVSVAPDGRVTVLIGLTVPFCVAVATIMQSVERRVSELAGVRGVHVEIDQDTPWGPELMTDKGRDYLARRRSRS